VHPGLSNLRQGRFAFTHVSLSKKELAESFVKVGSLADSLPLNLRYSSEALRKDCLASSVQLAVS